jgi:hypothetical protein
MNNMQQRAGASAARYRARPHRRWHTRLAAVALSLGGLLGLWGVIAHLPAAPARSTPTLQDAEQQLQIGGSTSSQNWFSPQGAPRPPDVVSGVS